VKKPSAPKYVRFFKEGDVVRLRSGGPAMTVASVDSGTVLECVWQDRNGKMCQWTFDYGEPARVLRRTKPDKWECNDVAKLGARAGRRGHRCSKK